MNHHPFHENVVILTGASHGIGEEVAYQLASHGAWLSLAARDTARLESVASNCQRRGGRAIAVPTDVSDPAQCQHLVEKTLEAFGRIDTLINNAGISMWAVFEDVKDLTVFDKIMQVNYLGAVYCTHYALPYLKQSRGRIVAVSSLAGKAGVPTRTGYAASKHAMVGFFDTLRIELAPYGVSVTIIYPDFVKSGIRERAFRGDGQPLGKSPVQEDKVMSAETCARMIVDAAADRRRENIQTMRGKLGQWIKLIAPSITDRIAAKAIREGK